MKRLLLFILLSVVLGVITSYLIAWGCALFASSPMKEVWLTKMDENERSWLVSQHGSAGYTYLVGGAWTYDVSAWDEREPPWWSRSLQKAVPEHTRFQRQTVWDCEVVAGWPVVCTRCDFTAERVRGQIVLHITRGVESDRVLPNAVPRIYPIDPIWRGLLANSAVFGSAWFILLGVPTMIVRVRRRRAGRCLHCGYDLRATTGDKCPECGRGK